MIKHSKNWWAARYDEDAYASGKHDTDAYEMQKLDDEALDNMPYPKSFGGAMFPMSKKVKEELESQDDGIFGGTIHDTGEEAVEGNREEFIQDTYYLDHLLSQIQGEIPQNSYTIHWQDHIKSTTPADNNMRYESYGCFVLNLVLKCPTRDITIDSFPSWDITDRCFSTKYEDGEGTDVDSLDKKTWIPIATSPIITHCDLLIGGENTIAQEFELEIAAMYDLDGTHDEENARIKFPSFLGFESVNLTIKFKNYDEYKKYALEFMDIRSENSDFTAVISIGTDTYTVSNLMVFEAELNQIPERGIAQYDITFHKTADTTIVKT